MELSYLINANIVLQANFVDGHGIIPALINMVRSYIHL